ncbi:hypothetical protein [Derxia gummosa]|uniref:TM2 domain-containing protein n=1 Tax=Derxia gummosa DSM 723 TaxID=1121388 RepID=A0A8B6X3K0_9BURK|nr:hypothetical protein [Derxia gummosa]
MRHRERFTAALLAFAGAPLGAHCWYLGQRRAPVYPLALAAGMLLFGAVGSARNAWLAVLVLLPVWIAWCESLAIAVMPDERWDARWNAVSPRHSRNSWNCVFLAIAVLLVGATTLLTAIIVAAQLWYEVAPG